MLVLSPDPYLTFLVERHPDGPSVTVGDRDLRVASIVDADADLVLCEHDDPRLAELRRVIGARLLVVGPPDAGRSTTMHVINRPLSAAEVQRAIDLPGSLRPTPLGDPVGYLGGIYPVGLTASGLVAALVLHARGMPLPLVLPAYAVTVYGLLRTRLRHPAYLAADTGLAVLAAIVVLGSRGAFVLFSLVVAAGLGFHATVPLALAGGTLIGLANAIGAEVLPAGASVDLAAALPAAMMFPLVSALAASGSQRARALRDSGDPERLGVLLRELRVLARGEPQALRLSEVARNALTAVLDASGTERGVALIPHGDGYRVVAEVGHVALRDVELRWPALTRTLQSPIATVDDVDLPPTLADVAEGREVTLVALRDASASRGVVVLPDTLSARRRRAAAHAAADAGTRIANAQAFARLRTDTVDEERRRLAGELHDSTAQVLAHVRLELQLLARTSSEHVDELARLARVVGRAQDDLRSVIDGLRASVEEEGLAGALRSYVADLRGQSGPALRFAAHVAQRHDPEVEGEVFRIAQEAISNAVRHAGAANVQVELETDVNGIVLTVDDDGDGLGQGDDRNDGLGIGQMRERATRIGGVLDLTSSSTGTRVTLRVGATPSGPSATERSLRA